MVNIVFYRESKVGCTAFIIMPSKSNIDLIVLALIAEEPIHGYDLVKRSVDDRISDWADLPPSSVYLSLKNLEQKGYIKAKEVRVGKSPPRSVYRITGSGRSALVGSLLRLLTEPLNCRDDFNIALMGVESIPKDKSLEAIEIHREQVSRKYEEMKQYLEENNDSMKLTYRSIYSRLIAQYHAHLDWLADFEKQIKAL